MKTALEEIVSGQHNDAKCKWFQEEHEKYFGVAPPKCKFKENPKEIPKLIEKIDLNKAKAIAISKLKSAADHIANILEYKSVLDEETLREISEKIDRMHAEIKTSESKSTQTEVEPSSFNKLFSWS